MTETQVLEPKLSASALDQKLRNYAVRREVGHGAMGIVYEATQVGLGRQVALKVLPPQLALRERTVRRFVREAEAMGRLSHPNIVDIYEVGSEDDVHYFAMRFVEGPPLDEVLRAGPLAVGDVVQIGIHVAEALAHAHGRGVMHRDIKPSNLLRDGERVVLTDFGLARPMESDETGTMTESGDLVGTPLYMSPEQIGGESARIDGRADVWGLGVTLYELLTQTPPFTGAGATAILSKILHKDPPLLRKLRPDVPRDLEAVVLKCLEKDPARRYSGAAALLEDLRAVRDGRPVLAAKPRFWDPAVRWARRHPLESAVAAGALVVMAGLWVSWSVTRKRFGLSEEARGRAEQEQKRAEADAALAHERHAESEAGRQRALDDARVYNAQGELVKAQRVWMNAAARLASGSLDPAQASFYRAQQEHAEAAVRRLYQAFPADTYPEISLEAMKVLAALMNERGMGEEALSFLTGDVPGGVGPRPMVAQPESDMSLLGLAAVYVGLNRLEDALFTHMRRLQRDPANASAAYEAGALARELAELDALGGHRASMESRLREAWALLDRAHALARARGDDTLLAKVKTERARLLALRGSRAADGGQAVLAGELSAAARRDLVDALTLDPALASAQALLAELEAPPAPVSAAQPPPSPRPRFANPLDLVDIDASRIEEAFSRTNLETLGMAPLPGLRTLGRAVSGVQELKDIRDSQVQILEAMMKALRQTEPQSSPSPPAGTPPPAPSAPDR